MLERGPVTLSHTSHSFKFRCMLHLRRSFAVGRRLFSSSTVAAVSTKRGPSSASMVQAAQTSIRPWHLQDIVCYEHLRPGIYQTVTGLGVCWFAFNAVQGYEIVNTPALAEIGLTVPAISMAASLTMLAASHFFSNYSIARITLLKGGTHVRLTRHTLFGTLRDKDIAVDSLRLHSEPDEKQGSYRFTIDGERSNLYLIFDRSVPFKNREALCYVFRNPYLSQFIKP